MARYKVTINTDAYVLQSCSKKNWERGTRNDFMVALNGWHTTEYSLKQVYWRIWMFQGNSYPHSEWDEQKKDWSDAYTKWKNKKCNKIKYLDKLCGFEREHEIRGYGWTQGYFNVEKVMDELKQTGTVKIPFAWLYDVRQYYKGMNGCYMEITKVA